jgi:hypothetical protein
MKNILSKKNIQVVLDTFAIKENSMFSNKPIFFLTNSGEKNHFFLIFDNQIKS